MRGQATRLAAADNSIDVADQLRAAAKHGFSRTGPHSDCCTFAPAARPALAGEHVGLTQLQPEPDCRAVRPRTALYAPSNSRPTKKPLLNVKADSRRRMA